MKREIFIVFSYIITTVLVYSDSYIILYRKMVILGPLLILEVFSMIVS